MRVYKRANRRRLYGEVTDPAAIFETIYRKRLWGKGESASGSGSTVAGTAILRADLAVWLEQEEIALFVDLPCGDFNWMRLVRFPAGMRYLGMDIVQEIVDENVRRHQTELITFRHADILSSELPEADAYFCKDLFIHFPNAEIGNAIRRLRGKTRFLLASTFPNTKVNPDIPFGDVRPTNLSLMLGEPVAMLRDFDRSVKDRYIGVWRL